MLAEQKTLNTHKNPFTNKLLEEKKKNNIKQTTRWTDAKIGHSLV
jgi:hypothetical protein